MGDAEYTFAQARARLEDIVGQVRKKDMSLEHSLDLLEEGVRLASACTEQIDQSEWRALAEESQPGPNDETADFDPARPMDRQVASDADDAAGPAAQQ